MPASGRLCPNAFAGDAMFDHGYARYIIRETDGYTAAYGPYTLESAFQPIFRSQANGTLRLEAFEGLVRPRKDVEPVSPGAFFSAVRAEDRATVDAVCRRLHMLNVALLGRRNATLFLNFDPSLFESVADTTAEAARLADLAGKIGLSLRQIVCEITEKRAASAAKLLAITEGFRACGFRIAVDDYGAEESDSSRIDLLKPDIVKFDGEWVLRYMDNPPGIELLRDTARRFRDRGITTLFEGLEHDWQVDLCQELEIDLLQGFALARPEMLPTRFNELFPENGPPDRRTLMAEGVVPAAAKEPPGSAVAPALSAPARKPFGRRGL
jgi:EAL domain-containing protein (putative c-di-GMP-specific phosphodiesterase class I)